MIGVDHVVGCVAQSMAGADHVVGCMAQSMAGADHVVGCAAQSMVGADHFVGCVARSMVGMDHVGPCAVRSLLVASDRLHRGRHPRRRTSRDVEVGHDSRKRAAARRHLVVLSYITQVA
jgi:hypothetical protein